MVESENKKPSVRGGSTQTRLVAPHGATSAFAIHLAREAGWYGRRPNSKCNFMLAQGIFYPRKSHYFKKLLAKARRLFDGS